MERPERCFVEIYKQYCLHRPPNVKVNAFYRAPIINPIGIVWYKNRAIGANTLATTMKRLCSKAGVGGYKTNHSLRVTSATRLFQCGTDEQLIMRRTGHRSTDGVRVYKCSSDEQEALLSKVLNREKSALLPPSAFKSLEKENELPTNTKKSGPVTPPKAQSASSIASSHPASASFFDCTGVTINFHFGSM